MKVQIRNENFLKINTNGSPKSVSFRASLIRRSNSSTSSSIIKSHINKPALMMNEKKKSDFISFQSIPTFVFRRQNSTDKTIPDYDPSTIDILTFETEAKETLQDFCHIVEEALEEKIPGSEANYSDGIFTLNLGSLGSYVLNKQTPNRQIWFSSPVSGPKRYNYDKKNKTWVNTRDGHELRSFLSAELTKLTGVTVQL